MPFTVAPNIGSYHPCNEGRHFGIDAGGGQSMIVDYGGQLVGKQRDTNGSTFVAGVINIEALRHHRESAQVTNWMKDVRSELAQIIYEQPIYPKNRSRKNPRQARRLQARRHRQAGRADAKTRHLEEAGA